MHSSIAIDDERLPVDDDARPGVHRLIPSRLPGSSEQYGFDVDLDACSGCGACVAACHQENRLAPDVVWRRIGSLVGGTESTLPVMQPVTTACHHCLEPACMQGCPAAAYRKDDRTGIVLHIEDHCIGCQYCTLTCPYDVPVYDARRGTVSKCDMCHERLADGVAPACVRACPHEAIRIRIVERDDVRAAAQLRNMLPGAPDPSHTLPATTFQTSRRWPANTIPADFFSVRPLHGHWSLVVMLVLTQMSVGGFAAELLLHYFARMMHPAIIEAVRPVHLVATLLLGLGGMSAALLHLGRPQRAYRAVLGWRHSWLSREIIAFGLFAGTAALYVLLSIVDRDAAGWLAGMADGLGMAATACGLLAVFTSIMIYVRTRRPRWRFGRTATDFLLTTLVLGLPLTLVTSVAGALYGGFSVRDVTGGMGSDIAAWLLGVTLFKLAVEGYRLRPLGSNWFPPERRAAMLLRGDLSMLAVWQFVTSLLGGVLVPAVLLAQGMVSERGYDALFVGFMTLLSLLLLTVGELIGRYLFFATSVGPRMPGVVA